MAMGSGFLAAFLLRAQLQETLQPPDAVYFVVVAAGLLLSLGVLGSTLPVLAQISGARERPERRSGPDGDRCRRPQAADGIMPLGSSTYLRAAPWSNSA
jgi:hypothetical protein